MHNGRGLLYGLGAAVLLALGFFALRGTGGLLASLGKVVLWAAGIAAAAVAVVVALVLFSALRSSGRKGGSDTSGNSTSGSHTGNAELKPEEKEILTNAGRELSALRVLARRVKTASVRERSVQVCDSAAKILPTLRAKPETIPKARQFLHYYLPTMGKILQQYTQMEQSGVADAAMTQKILSYLEDIQTATKKQHSNLFEADMLDLTVEMEVMTTLCRRDGLLRDRELFFPKEKPAEAEEVYSETEEAEEAGAVGLML